MAETLRDFEARIRRLAPDAIAADKPGRASRQVRREWSEIAGDPSLGDGRSRLSAALMLLGAKGPSRTLLGQANVRALRWVDDDVRRSPEAEQLRLPLLPWRQRLMLALRRSAQNLAERIGLSCPH